MYFTKIDFGTPSFDEVLHLRDIVLRKPLNMVFTPLQITAEAGDHHFACYTENYNLVGTLLIKSLPDFVGKMRQVAVHPHYQGDGIGSYMVSEVEQWMLKNGYKSITLAARQEAVKFYTRLGYHIEGHPFEEVGIPHRTMVKSL